MTAPQLLTGLSEIASGYDALVCDVWGVLHNGMAAHRPACEAILRFRREHGHVVLVSNAPRPASDLLPQFDRLRVPRDCFDAIVTSGDAARADLASRAASGVLKVLHLGPERDRNIFAGIAVELTGLERAEIVLNTGPYNDDIETADDYRDMFVAMKDRGLTMICANPDRVVQRGGQLVTCAGALAEAYEAMGGDTVWYGKPYLPIYDAVRAELAVAAKPLAIGDGLHTDIKGANAAGMEALFIADGIHGEDVRDVTPEHLAALFAKAGVHAAYAMRALVW